MAELESRDCVTCENVYFTGKGNFIIFTISPLFQEREREREREKEKEREREREVLYLKTL